MLHKIKISGLFLLGCVLSFLVFWKITLHPDHVQILNKVFKYVDSGILTHFGNAATHVGYVPGTITTILTAVPMGIYFSAYSAWFVILIFHAVAWYLFSKTLKEIAGPLVVFDFLLLFWLNPWRLEQVELYNPAYVFLFSALHFYTAMNSRSPSFWMSFLNVLAIGLCVQLHLAGVVLGIASLLLIYFRFARINWWGVVAGVGAVILSLVPYLLELSQNQDIAVTAQSKGDSYVGRNLLYVYPILKSILYWIRYGSMYFARHLFGEINFYWLGDGALKSVVHSAFHILKWPLALGTLYYSFLFQKKAFLKIKSKGLLHRNDKTTLSGELRLYYYAFYLFVAMLVGVAFSPVEMTHWHLILCFPVVAAVMSLGMNNLRSEKGEAVYRKVYGALLVVFVLYNIVFSLGSRTRSFTSDFNEQVIKYYKSKDSWR